MAESSDFIAAIDQGTTSTRCMIFDHHGAEVARHQLEHEQILPRAGWVEHNPVEIWERTASVLISVLNATNLSPKDIAALGITNQRETTLVWNRHTGRPYYNAIVWQDTRTDRIASALDRDGRGNLIRRKAGLPPATYFSGGKLQWILENVDGVRAAAENGDALFGTPDTWVLWNLTGGPRGGVHVTDVTNASRTMLMDLETLDWDDELLSLFSIPRAMLPEIASSAPSEPYGVTLATGPVGGEVPITGVLGDQHAAMVGQVCLAPGEAKNTYGTGNFLLLNTGETIVRSNNGLLTTVCYQFGNAKPVYALEGSIAVTGSAVQWLRDQLGIISGAAQSEALARQVPDNGGMYFVPAFFRAVRAILAVRCARRDRRVVAVQHQRAPGARNAGGDLLPEPRCGGRHGSRLRCSPAGVEGGWRDHRQRPVYADPGRRVGCGCGAAGGRRDHRTRCGLRGGLGGRVLGGSVRSAGQLARGQAVDTDVGRRRACRGLCRLAQGGAADPGLG